VTENLEVRIDKSAHYGTGILAGIRQAVSSVKHYSLKFGAASNLLPNTRNSRPNQVRTGRSSSSEESSPSSEDLSEETGGFLDF
jgi:hypothetical protein